MNGSQYDVNTWSTPRCSTREEPPAAVPRPGSSQIKGSSPLVKFGEASREARGEGYRQAIDTR